MKCDRCGYNWGDTGDSAHVCVPPEMARQIARANQDAIDARRWRAVRQRYGVALCRMATDSMSYSSDKAPALLDAWADMAAAEIEAFDPKKWMDEEVPARIAELEREIRSEGHDG